MFRAVMAADLKYFLHSDPMLLIYKLPSFPLFLRSDFEVFGFCEKLLFLHNFCNTEFVIERAYFED